MNLMIIGSGMYVTGKEIAVGTVLGSVFQWSKSNDIKIFVVSATPSSAGRVEEAKTRLNQILGTQCSVTFSAINNPEGLKAFISENKIEVAIVSTPDHLHFEQLEIALGMGVHCLCVKPLVTQNAQHVALAKICEENRAFLAVEFHKRFDESFMQARKMLKEGELGAPRIVTADYSQRRIIPEQIFSDWRGQTNIFQYLGIHFVDLIGWIADAEPVSVKVNAWGNGDYSEAVQVQIAWELKSGEKLNSTLNISWNDSNDSPSMSYQRVAMLCSHGRLVIDQANRGIEVTPKDGGLMHLNPWFSEVLEDASGEKHLAGYGVKSIHAFLQHTAAILTGDLDIYSPSPLPSVWETGFGTKVLEAVNRCLSESIETELKLT
jgi:predicted dehydrogenase